MKTTFDLKEILEALKIPRDRFNDWLSRGYIKPSIRTQRGNRVIKSYTIEDIYTIVFFQHLTETMNMQREFAKILTDKFRSTIKAQLEYNRLLKHEFIAIRCENKHGENKIESYMGSKNHFLEMSTSICYNRSEDGEIHPFPPPPYPWVAEDNWTWVHVINLIQLKEKVDSAFL